MGISGKSKGRLVGVLLSAVSLVVGLFLLEGLLALIGSPQQLHDPVANPPGLSMEVDHVEFHYLWETNDQGLRYPTIPLRKPMGERRVFVVGDSFVDGEGVSIEERFSSLLESTFDDAYAPVRFVNGGLGGQGVLQYARIFQWVGRRYDPDGLLICINVNDLGDATPEALPGRIYDIVRPAESTIARGLAGWWPRLVTRVRMAGQAVGTVEDYVEDPADYDIEQLARRARSERIPEERIASWKEALPAEWVEWASEGRFPAYLLGWGLFQPDYFRTAIDVTGPTAEARWQAMAAVLEEMVVRARESGVEPAVVFLPNLYLYDPSAYGSESRFPFHYLGGRVRPEWAVGETEIQRRIADWADRADVPLLDLTEAFREALGAGEPLHYPLDGHWNPRGHALAAREIETWLVEQRPLGNLTR